MSSAPEREPEQPLGREDKARLTEAQETGASRRSDEQRSNSSARGAPVAQTSGAPSLTLETAETADHEELGADLPAGPGRAVGHRVVAASREELDKRSRVVVRSRHREMHHSWPLMEHEDKQERATVS